MGYKKDIFGIIEYEFELLQNDILLRNMIYGFCRMIYLLRKHDIRTRPADKIKDFERVPRNLVIRFAHNNIRSLICRRHISPTEGGYHIEDISPVPQGTDIIEKRQASVETCRFSWLGCRDSNPGNA